MSIIRFRIYPISFQKNNVQINTIFPVHVNSENKGRYE